EALVVALLLGDEEHVLELLRQHRRLGRERPLLDVELGGGPARDVDVLGLSERERRHQQERERVSVHRHPSYSSAQNSPSHGQNSSSSPIMLAFHIRPTSSSGNRPAARSCTSMSSLRFWPMTPSILPSLALSRTLRVSSSSLSIAACAR